MLGQYSEDRSCLLAGWLAGWIGVLDLFPSLRSSRFCLPYPEPCVPGQDGSPFGSAPYCCSYGSPYGNVGGLCSRVGGCLPRGARCFTSLSIRLVCRCSVWSIPAAAGVNAKQHKLAAVSYGYVLRGLTAQAHLSTAWYPARSFRGGLKNSSLQVQR